MGIASLLGILFPTHCPLCRNASHASSALPICASCWITIRSYKGPACVQCGLPTVSVHTERCRNCTEDPPSFVSARSYGLYEGVLKEAIHLLKFNAYRRLAQPLAALLSDLDLPAADALVPVPIHLNQLRTREFNQTALIAKHLSMITGTRLMLDGLSKVKDTVAQIDVDRNERLRNLKKAFSASQQVKDKRILLIDDVITTGATMRECAKSLMKAGAVEVNVVALARSMPKW